MTQGDFKQCKMRYTVTLLITNHYHPMLMDSTSILSKSNSMFQSVRLRLSPPWELCEFVLAYCCDCHWNTSSVGPASLGLDAAGVEILYVVPIFCPSHS